MWWTRRRCPRHPARTDRQQGTPAQGEDVRHCKCPVRSRPSQFGHQSSGPSQDVETPSVTNGLKIQIATRTNKSRQKYEWACNKARLYADTMSRLVVKCFGSVWLLSRESVPFIPFSYRFISLPIFFVDSRHRRWRACNNDNELLGRASSSFTLSSCASC